MTKQAKCSSCGKTLPRYMMFETNTGRIQLQCPDCYKKGMSDSGKFTLGRVLQYRDKMKSK